MREIRFRGKTTYGKEWVYGYFVRYGVECQIIDYTGESHIVNGDSVGEYTGLKDKNVKEIYKGDIVKYYFQGIEYILLIKYCNRTASFGCFLANDSPMMKVGFSHDSDKFEVIGNIHENPELLKE